MQKLYCYVDETGQDTKGKFFLVSVVISGKERENLRKFLIKTEKEAGKGIIKWRKASFKARENYLIKVFSSSFLSHSIFFSKYETTAYLDLTILTTAKAILERAKGDYRARVFVDGLDKKGVRKFGKGLRKLRIRVRKIRGLKDESDPLIRLADAAAGLLRDYFEGDNYAKKLYQKAKRNKIIKEV